MGIISSLKSFAGKAKEFVDGMDKIYSTAYNDAVAIQSRINNVSQKTISYFAEEQRNEFKGIIDYAISSFESLLDDTLKLYNSVTARKNWKKTRISDNPLLRETSKKIVSFPYEKNSGIDQILVHKESPKEKSIDQVISTNTEKERNYHTNENLKSSVANNYISRLDNISKSYSPAISSIAETLSGKKSYVASNDKGVVQRKAWKWEDRIRLLEQQYNPGILTSQDREGIEELEEAINKNNYLKYRKKEEYARVKSLIKSMKGGANAPP